MRTASAASERQVVKPSLVAGFRRKLFAWSTALLALLMPSSLFLPVAGPLVPGIFLPYVSPGLYLPDAAVLLLFVALLANRRQLERGPLEITVPLIGLFALALLTAPWALSAPLALVTSARWLIALGVYLCFAQRMVKIDQIVMIFLGGLCLQTIVGLGQVGLKGPLGIPGELAIANSAELAWTYRAFGLTFHPNVLGGFLTVGLLLSLPLLKRKVVLAGWWLIWLGLVATFSRSAWLAAAVTMPPALFWHYGRKPEMRRPLSVALIGLLIVLAAAGLMWQKQMAIRLQPLLNQAQGALAALSSTETGPSTAGAALAGVDLDDPLSSSGYAISERFVQYKIAFMAIQGSLLQGVGAGNFPVFMRQFNPGLTPNFVHNVPLMLAAEIGLLGAGLWLIMALALAWWLVKFWKGGPGWLVVALCAGLALAVIAMFDFYPWGLNTGRLLTAMVLGLIARFLPGRLGRQQVGQEP